MTADVELYREPEDVLRKELGHLKDRLKQERAEVKQFEALRDKRDGALEVLIAAAQDDAGKTESLVNDYRAAIRRVVGRRST